MGSKHSYVIIFFYKKNRDFVLKTGTIRKCLRSSSFKLGGDDLWWYSESEQLNIYRRCFFFFL